MLVLLPSLYVCLSWVGVAGAGNSSPDDIVCPQPGDPDHFTRCCGPEWARQCCEVDNKELIDGLETGSAKSAKSEDEVLPRNKDLLFKTKSVLEDEKYLNGFLIEISVVIVLVVVLCIICSIPLIMKIWGGVSQDQADQEGQQFDIQHQEDDPLHQRVLRPYSASYQPRSARTPQPLPLRPDSPHPGGNAPYRHMNTGLMTDTEDGDQDDYPHSYFNFIQERQYFDFPYMEALHQGVLRPYSARTYQPLSAGNPRPLPRRPDSPHPGDSRSRWLNARLTTDTEDVDQDNYPFSYNMATDQISNFDFPRNHQEPEQHQGLVYPCSARTYQSRMAYQPHPPIEPEPLPIFHPCQHEVCDRGLFPRPPRHGRCLSGPVRQPSSSWGRSS